MGSWSNGGYTVRNDVWGGGAGPQTIWANSYSNFGVWANHPNTGGVKSYPHSAKNIGKRISALGTLTSSFNVSRPGSGSYSSAYDIWAGNNAYEIMLWMNKQGAVGPLGSKQTTASVGGHTWDVYKGSNGSNQVFSFVRTGEHQLRQRRHQGRDELDQSRAAGSVTRRWARSSSASRSPRPAAA